MPRKVRYGVYYDDNYDDDAYEEENYDYKYDYQVEDNTETTAKQGSVKTGIWRCPICTYDNEDYMSTCDTCGVEVIAKSDTASVGDICNDFGASVMAKSLFASLSQQTPKKSIISPSSCRDHRNINIEAFKFDVPSPDDLVSALGSLKLKSKDNVSRARLHGRVQ